MTHQSLEQPTTTTLDGSTDFAHIDPDQLVVHRGLQSGRSVLLPAGAVLTSERTPLDAAPDGGAERLDGYYATKLGGRVVGISVSTESLRK